MQTQTRKKFVPVVVDLTAALTCLCYDLDIDSSSVRYMHLRLKHEGVKFLTVTLPRLSKAVLRSLELGYFDRPTDFAWRGSSLHFMYSSLSKIFHVNGTLRDDACPDAIYRIRQLCDYAYKLAFSFTEIEQARNAQKYVSTDSEIVEVNQVNLSFFEAMRKAFETHYPRTSKLAYDDVVSGPRFGPGSFAHHSSANNSVPHFDVCGRVPFYLEKGVTVTTVSASHASFSGRFKSYPSSSEKIHIVPDEEKACEVLFVPKDSRGPRTIAREPKNNLRVQMSYFDAVSSSLERETHGRIQFSDQNIMRDLARVSSEKGTYATLDLQEASDRVSLVLVKHVMQYSPGLLNAILLCRSTHAILPDGSKIALKKLSSMGSGLTFPTMALIIHLAICTRISQTHALPYHDVMRSVYVYGDDIIVPTRYVQTAYDALSLCGLRVNQNKSYWTGKFRESCGGDYYNGVDVTPVRLKLSNAGLNLPSTVFSLDQSGIVQLEAHCRALKHAGLWALAEYYYKAIERSLGKLPYVSGNSPVLGRYLISDTLITGIEDKKVTAWVKGTVSEKSLAVSHDVELGKALRADKEQIVYGVDVIPPARDFTMVDVPRKITLRKRRVYDTCFLGK